jgi:hypothetical protein
LREQVEQAREKASLANQRVAEREELMKIIYA